MIESIIFVTGMLIGRYLAPKIEWTLGHMAGQESMKEVFKEEAEDRTYNAIIKVDKGDMSMSDLKKTIPNLIIVDK